MKSLANSAILFFVLFAVIFPQTGNTHKRSAVAGINFPAARNGRIAKNENRIDSLIWLFSTTLNNKTGNNKVEKKFRREFMPERVLIDDTLRIIFSYESNGRLYGLLFETKSGSEWINDMQVEHNYNDWGNRVSTYISEWQNEQWRYRYQYLFTYDNYSRVNTEEFAVFNGVSFTNSSKGIYSYDESGNILTSVRQLWENMQWVNELRNTMTYDARGNQLSVIYDNWRNATWAPAQRNTSEYDSNNRQLSETYEYYNSGNWALSLRELFEYNGNGDIISYLQQRYNANEWRNITHDIYEYDYPGRIQRQLTQNWVDGSWINTYRSITTFTENGLLGSYTTEFWINSRWDNKHYITNQYDGVGNLLVQLEQEDHGNGYVDVSKREYWYDNYNNAVRGVSSYWLDGAWQRGEGSLNLSYNNGTSAYSNYGTELVIKYKEVTTGVNDDSIVLSSFRLQQNYPNPFNPETAIEYELHSRQLVQITVYNLLGVKIAELINSIQDAGHHSVKFYGGQLASGVYIYEMRAGSSREIRKMSLLK